MFINWLPSNFIFHKEFLLQGKESAWTLSPNSEIPGSTPVYSEFSPVSFSTICLLRVTCKYKNMTEKNSRSVLMCQFWLLGYLCVSGACSHFSLSAGFFIYQSSFYCLLLYCLCCFHLCGTWMFCSIEFYFYCYLQICPEGQCETEAWCLRSTCLQGQCIFIRNFTTSHLETFHYYLLKE